MISSCNAMDKFARLWKSKRSFPNKNEGTVAYSRSAMTSRIATADCPVNFEAIFAGTPTGGFTEAMGYTKAGSKPRVRWTPGHGWIGDTAGITKVALKKGPQTLVLTPTKVQVMGTGNYYMAFHALVQNGYCPKRLENMTPKHVKIDGKFNVNKEIDLHGLESALDAISVKAKYESELFPALVFKWPRPALTFQVFENGTVLFTGIKDPKDINVPKTIFKELFTKYGISKQAVFYGLHSKALPRKRTTATNKTLLLASKYNAAKNWNNVRPGFYVRPGTDGAPRFYPYRRMVAAEGGYGGLTNVGPVNLTGVRPKVLKAFKEAGVPIPAHTLKVLGLDANAAAESPKGGPKFSNRRAASWNATRNGYYVRPGPGKQPYWFKVPKHLDAGRKTVIKTYTDAGRNIPTEVRRLFKISNSVQTKNEGPVHRIVMGPNKLLRINDRQATRLTIPELLAVARNLGIAQVNKTMRPAEIIGWIMTKANGPNRVNAVVNGTKYTVLNNGRIQRNKGAKRTIREWKTLSEAEQTTVAKAVLGAELFEEFQGLPKNDRFRVLRGMANAAAEAPKGSPAGSNSTVSTPSINISNLEGADPVRNDLQFYLGEYFKNADVNAFKARLPKNKKHAPVQLERWVRIYAKELRDERRNALIAENYASKIKVPNFVPVNLRNKFKNALLFAATNTNAKGKYPSKSKVRATMEAWVKAHVAVLPRRAAYEKENVATGNIIKVPGWSPTKVNYKLMEVPNRVSPARALPSKKPRAPPKPRAKKSPTEALLAKNYALPNSNAVENLANAVMRLGLPIGKTNTYTWAGLRRAGLNEKYRNTWIKHVARAGSKSPGTLRSEVNALKTAAARKKWLAGLNNVNRAAMRAHVAQLNQAARNKRKA